MVNVLLLRFRGKDTKKLPFSKEEWQFAASGGILSQGYSYSGSNNPGDVAWFVGNSGRRVHEVKQLTPNELGLYDMSGNIEEIISPYYEWDGWHYYVMGGNYETDETGIGIYSCFGAVNDSRGLRLALRCE